jgi:hypothetical protein
MNHKYYIIFPVILSILILLGSCIKTETESKAVFEILDPVKTGIHFSNDLEMTLDFNIFKYMYFYNGAGVGLGDFNNDGWIDIYLVGNMVPDKLYLNRGDFNFEDVTESSGILHFPAHWATGVSVVDINQDGLLDLYISQVSDFKRLEGSNKLYICTHIDENGIPHYEEKAAEWGLDLVGFGTQALFFDYDLDGDLDFMQLNHSVHANGTFGQRKIFADSLHPKAGDRFFRNDSGSFNEISRDVGIFYNAIGYGLGIVASDINMNGYPDIYVGNDFHENDYLYENKKDGSFKEVLTERIMHTSRFSMGVDAADLNNDGLTDIFSLDMLPYDPEILKRSEGEDALATFNFKLGYGYNHQYAKNCLQMNNGNGTFSEIAQYAGIYATDWSWSTLLFDFDNDGYKDIFVSNGIPKRMNDIDYINFVSDDDMKWKIRNADLEEQDLNLIKNIPEIKLPNKLLKNKGNMSFEDQESKILNNQISYSNGAAYADLNNDGKVDMVVNNINDKAFIYRNITQHPSNKMIALDLKGYKGNINAIGAKVIVYRNTSQKQVFEKFPVRGFQSSMETPLYIGLGDVKEVDSIILIWPNNTYQSLSIENLEMDGKLNSITYNPSTLNEGLFNYTTLTEDKRPYLSIRDITELTEVNFEHKENPFVEFNRELLIPHMTSSDGPALAVGDINNDGLEDFYVGGSKKEHGALYLQLPNGTFRQLEIPALKRDSIYEDVEALIIDVNGDGWSDLVIGSGGNEFFNNDPNLESRVYLNDQKGQFIRKEDAMEGIFATVSTLSTSDINGDGFPDIYLGARAVPWAYGEVPDSHLLLNDGTGKFSIVTDEWHKDLKKLGLIKHSIWIDWDQDGKEDLIVAVEWGGIYVFYNRGNTFEKEILVHDKGWWNVIVPFFPSEKQSGTLFFGNLGWNSRLKASKKEPVRMYYADFDDNGTKEQILTYFLQGREIAFTNMADLLAQLPSLKKKYLYAKDFAKASLAELLGQKKLKESLVYEANNFSNAILRHQKKQSNSLLEHLPWQGQLTPFKTGIAIDINLDGRDELLLYGNYYGNNVQLGRYDANFGSILFIDEQGGLRVEPVKGLPISGEVRRIKTIKIGGMHQNKTCIILARNDDFLKIVSLDMEHTPL